MSVTINTDALYFSGERPKPHTPISIGVFSSPYSDDVKLTLGDALNADLSPEQAIDLGQELLALGSYHQIFRARFGVADRDAKVSRVAEDNSAGTSSTKPLNRQGAETSASKCICMSVRVPGPGDFGQFDIHPGCPVHAK
jgi:hypothetical protein